MASTKIPKDDPAVEDADDDDEDDSEDSDDDVPELEEADGTGRQKQSKMEKKSRCVDSSIQPLPFGLSLLRM